MAVTAGKSVAIGNAAFQNMPRISNSNSELICNVYTFSFPERTHKLGNTWGCQNT